jgi:flagellar motor switch/type III secretory pathway protein FliN
MTAASARAAALGATEKPEPAASPSPQGPGNPQSGDQDEIRWQPFLRLPIRLTVDLPLPDFKVRDFLALRVGSIVGTQWGLARDVPLAVNGTFIAWGELEGAGQRLAVRATELA